MACSTLLKRAPLIRGRPLSSGSFFLVVCIFVVWVWQIVLQNSKMPPQRNSRESQIIAIFRE
jgi:hypothetical protein